jgi:hypothetical protein
MAARTLTRWSDRYEFNTRFYAVAITRLIFSRVNPLLAGNENYSRRHRRDVTDTVLDFRIIPAGASMTVMQRGVYLFFTLWR